MQVFHFHFRQMTSSFFFFVSFLKPFMKLLLYVFYFFNASLLVHNGIRDELSPSESRSSSVKDHAGFSLSLSANDFSLIEFLIKPFTTSMPFYVFYLEVNTLLFMLLHVNEDLHILEMVGLGDVSIKSKIEIAH